MRLAATRAQFLTAPPFLGRPGREEAGPATLRNDPMIRRLILSALGAAGVAAFALNPSTAGAHPYGPVAPVYRPVYESHRHHHFHHGHYGVRFVVPAPAPVVVARPVVPAPVVVVPTTPCPTPAPVILPYGR